MNRTDRATILRHYGASPSVVEELLEYNESLFSASDVPDVVTDEPFVATWSSYVEEAEEDASQTVFDVLQKKLPQLQFPVEAGISKTETYRKATLQGATVPAGTGIELEAPEALECMLHPSAAGRIPVLVAGTRADFEVLVQALTRRNEPTPIPASMGACMVSGFSNWDRIHAYRRAWLARPDTQPQEWGVAFRALIPQKEKYQDRFILLNRGPYSNVTAKNLGLEDDEWERLSLIIRMEHECAHYVTERYFGGMNVNVTDEIISDYAGVTEAVGHFRAEWFLWFMGLEKAPRYREGGRLEAYCEALSDEAIAVLRRLVVPAAETLETVSTLKPEIKGTQAVQVLIGFCLEDLAAEGAAERIIAQCSSLVHS